MIFYIYSQIRKSGVTDAIVIDAEDTDVIVLAVHVSHKIEGILGIKRKISIFDFKLLCSESDAKIIVPLHIHTGGWGRCNFWILWSRKEVGCEGDF